MHSYDVTGHPKVKVIFFIAIFSVTIATWLNISIDLLERRIGMPISITFSSITAFGILYLLFSKVVWKCNVFTKIFRYPNLNGKYTIIGESLKDITKEKFNWQGVLLVKQDWDKILVSMKSNNSSSESTSVNGSIVYRPMKGYELTYSYENIPSNTQAELHKHNGTCTLTFDEELNSAIGNYYNDGKDRKTYGCMNLRRANA